MSSRKSSKLTAGAEKAEELRACACQVDIPLAEVFWVWREQANYGEWFDIIGEVGIAAFV